MSIVNKIINVFRRPKEKGTITTIGPQKITGTLPSQGGKSGNDTPSFTSSKPTTSTAPLKSSRGGGRRSPTSPVINNSEQEDLSSDYNNTSSQRTLVNQLREKISSNSSPSGSLPSQVQHNTTRQNVMTAVNNFGGTLKVDPYKMSFFSGVSQTVKNVGNVGKIGKEGLKSYYNDIWNPLSNTNFGMKKPNVNPRWRGTITSDDFTPSGYKDTSLMSYGDIKVNQDLAKGQSPDLIGVTDKSASERIQVKIEKRLNEKYNKQFNEELSGVTDEKIIEQKEKEYQAKYQDEFSSEYKNAYKDYKSKSFDIQPLVEMEKTPGKFIKFGTETAILSLVGGLPEAKILGDLAMGRLGGKAYSLVQKDSYLGMSMEKDILNRLGKMKFGGRDVEIGKEVWRGDKGSLFKINARRTDPYGLAKQEVSFDLPVFRIEKNTKSGIQDSLSYFVKGGKSTTKIHNPLTDETKIITNKFTGGGRIPTRADGFTYTTKNKVSIPFKDTEIGLGSGYLKLKDGNKIKYFKTLGISKEDDFAYNIASGKPSTIKYGQMLKLGNTKVKGGIDAYGKIIKMPTFTESGSGSFISRGSKSNFDSGLSLASASKGNSPIGATDTLKELQITKFDMPVQKVQSNLYPSLSLKEDSRGSSSQVQINKNDLKLVQINSLQPKPIQRDRSFFSSTGALLSPTLKENTKLIQLPVFKQPQISREKQKQIFSPRLSGRYNFFNEPYTTKKSFMLPFLPLVPPFEEYGRSRKGKSKNRFKSRYTPNIASIGLNIKASKIPISYYKGAGGIALRPMIVNSKRRKRKGKR